MNIPTDLTTLERELTTPLSEGGGMFCAQNSEGYAINGVTYQWPRGSKLKWGKEFTALGAISSDDVISCIKEFLKEISECCDVFFEYITNPLAANIKLTRMRLDGASGVLADMQIPVGNVSAENSQLLGRFDDSENWVLADNPPANTIDFYRVGLHEWLHAMGLGHKPASVQVPALISPIYSPTMRHLQAADKSELIRRYGVPQTPIAPPPTSGSKPINCSQIITIEQGGKKWKGTLSGVLLPVQ